MVATPARPFQLSATVDFPDDCKNIPYTEELLGHLFDRLRWVGVRRIHWMYYQRGMWDVFIQFLERNAEMMRGLGDPLRLACRLAHERGLEFVAVVKPYETGASSLAPIPSPGRAPPAGLAALGGTHAWVDPWVVARPEMRVRRRGADAVAPGIARLPVARIELRQRDDAPLRFSPDRLQLWTSPDNRGFRRHPGAFTVSERVEPTPDEVVDLLGNRVATRGQPRRVLALEGAAIHDPFVAVTTDLAADAPGTFRNTALEMVRAVGPGGEPLPISPGSQKALWRPERDFRSDNLEFDAGMAGYVVALDVANDRVSNGASRDGVIAFARGHNTYVAAALCEAYPEVQEYWLGWVSECIAAGVDAVDFRISNHGSWTDWPERFGFNEPVAEEYRRRYGVDPDLEPYDPEHHATLRGELYEGFLRRARRRLAAAGRAMHLHVELESFRPDATLGRRLTRPGNITMDWRSWLRAGLADEVQLMAVTWMPDRALADPMAAEVLAEAATRGLPVTLRHPMWHGQGDGPLHADRLEHAARHGGLGGYNFYETAALYDGNSLDPAGRLAFYPGLLEALHDRAVALGIP